MKLVIFTIVLDGMPWITRIWPELEKLKLDWQWNVVEGVSANVACTRWCSTIAPRLSEDGTTEYLNSIAAYDKRICLFRKELWHGKVAQCNEPLRFIYEPCILMQMDSDELWTAEQITKLHAMFQKNHAKNCAYFYADYRVGQNVRITSRNTYGNNAAYEWLRAWRFNPGMKFASHEPPKLERFEEKPFTHAETEKEGLIFRHEAYSTEAQVRFKEVFYGSENNEAGKLYKGAVKGWRKLQENRKWPVQDLSQYLPWVGAGVTADLVKPAGGDFLC